MQIKEVAAYHLNLPFTVDFSHSRRTGAAAENVAVEIVTDRDGIRGYGEGAPRPYVTGETPESVMETVPGLVESAAFPRRLEDVGQIWRFVDGTPLDGGSNAALCAVETALLDALGKARRQAVTTFFDHRHMAGQVFYGATIPLTTTEHIVGICEVIRRLGITTVRIKMGRDAEQNLRSLEAVRSFFGKEAELRVDVNGAWSGAVAMEHLHVLERHGVRVLEQPLLPGDEDLAQVAEAVRSGGIILMADESCCTMEDMDAITKDGRYGMVNVRVSKCGGFRRSLEIVRKARKGGLAFQVGCQLGESGILSAAGRALGLLCGDATYWDGSYDAFLLKDNVTSESVGFGYGGAAGPLNGPGLGVKIDPAGLERLSGGRVRRMATG